jgi:hypothetical protein
LLAVFLKSEQQEKVFYKADGDHHSRAGKSGEKEKGQETHEPDYDLHGQLRSYARADKEFVRKV